MPGRSTDLPQLTAEMRLVIHCLVELCPKFSRQWDITGEVLRDVLGAQLQIPCREVLIKCCRKFGQISVEGYQALADKHPQDAVDTVGRAIETIKASATNSKQINALKAQGKRTEAVSVLTKVMKVLLQGVLKSTIERRIAAANIRKAAIRMQSVARRNAAKAAFMTAVSAAVSIQSMARGLKVFRRFVSIRKAAIQVQSAARHNAAKASSMLKPMSPPLRLNGAGRGQPIDVGDDDDLGGLASALVTSATMRVPRTVGWDVLRLDGEEIGHAEHGSDGNGNEVDVVLSSKASGSNDGGGGDEDKDDNLSHPQGPGLAGSSDGSGRGAAALAEEALFTAVSAAVVIQSMVRGVKVFRRFVSIRKAVIQVQSAARRNAAKAALVAAVSAAVVIQSMVRGVKVFRQFATIRSTNPRDAPPVPLPSLVASSTLKPTSPLRLNGAGRGQPIDVGDEVDLGGRASALVKLSSVVGWDVIGHPKHDSDGNGNKADVVLSFKASGSNDGGGDSGGDGDSDFANENSDEVDANNGESGGGLAALECLIQGEEGGGGVGSKSYGGSGSGSDDATGTGVDGDKNTDKEEEEDERAEMPLEGSKTVVKADEAKTTDAAQRRRTFVSILNLVPCCSDGTALAPPVARQHLTSTSSSTPIPASSPLLLNGAGRGVVSTLAINLGDEDDNLSHPQGPGLASSSDGSGRGAAALAEEALFTADVAAVVIQSMLRGLKVFQQFVSIRKAAIQVQSAARRNAAKAALVAAVSAAVVIQSMARGVEVSRRFLSIRKAAIQVQSAARRNAAKAALVAAVSAAVVIQSMARGVEVSRRCLSIRKAAIQAQSAARRNAAKAALVAAVSAAVVIQSMLRGLKVFQQFVSIRKAAIQVQSAARRNAAKAAVGTPSASAATAVEDVPERGNGGSERGGAAALAESGSLSEGQFADTFTPDKAVSVAGRAYFKIGVLGKGGSSKVYRVLSSEGDIFALKRVRVSSNDPKCLEGFKNEIALMEQLRGNPYIVQLLSASIDDGGRTIHMVMEVGETDLQGVLQRHKRQGSLCANFVRLAWQQMLTAVSVIHEERIVHGDLKPANFLFVQGHLKLIDFGIAKQIESKDTTNIYRESQVGTLNYMGPEAIKESGGGDGGGGGGCIKLGRASDVWSLGCILFQMVYGYTPFSDLNHFAKMMAIVNHDIVFQLHEDASLMQVMQEGCLVRDPSKRHTIQNLLRHPYLEPANVLHQRETEMEADMADLYNSLGAAQEDAHATRQELATLQADSAAEIATLRQQLLLASGAAAASTA